MLNKSKVEKLYKEGRNAVYIALELGAEVCAVRKCIQRNFSHLKSEHEIAKLRDKEILRVTSREAKQYMSDKDFVKRNQSIYKVLENGDKVLDREVLGTATVSFDTPRRLRNEDSYDRVNENIIKAGYRKETELFSCKA